MQLCKNHDSILRSIEAFEHKERLWIILELMDKGMLASAIEKYSSDFDEKIIKYVLKCALMGLDFLHTRGIMHRDMKSDNLLMSSNGEVKLCDFGFSVLISK